RPIIDPQSGTELVQRLVHQDITVTPDPNTNSLIVMAPTGSIDMMQMLIDMLDNVQPVTVEVQVFPLVNADATEMQQLLEDLFQPTGGSANVARQLIMTEGGPGAPPIALPDRGSAPTAEVSFAVDQRTNSLIAAGNAAQLRIVERLVLQLDHKEIEERV